MRPEAPRSEDLIGYYEQVSESKFLLHLRSDHTCLSWISNSTVFPVRPPTEGRWSVREDRLEIQWPQSTEVFDLSREAGVLHIHNRSVDYKKTPNQSPEPTASGRGSS